MPLSNRLKIWTPRIVVVLLVYLAYLWAYEASATCATVCTASDANAAVFHSIGRALPYVLLGLAFVSLGIVEIGAMFWMMARGRSYIVYPHEYDTSFEDVRGQEPVVESVRDVVKLFRGFREFKELGGSPPKGILLEGPPGTGKTLLAKAVAGTVGVPFIYTSATSFATMFMGAGNLRVMALFRKAKKFVRQYNGAVIFIDEIDALGSRGGSVSAAFSGITPLNAEALPEGSPTRNLISRFMGPANGMGAGIVNELLVQMDGLVMPRGYRRYVSRILHLKPRVPAYNILVIAATNRAQVLDPALLRPGRFDRKIHVGLPDKEGRRDVIGYYLQKVQHGPLDLEKFAQVTIGYSPARIKNIINEALIIALQDGRQSLTWEDLWQAKLLEEIGLKQPVKYTDREKVRTAVHEAGHAVASHELRSDDTRIQVITIIKRQESLGLVHSMELEERFSKTREDVLGDIKVCLAGMVAEEVWFGTSSTGAASDLQQATLLALQYVGQWGMGKHLLAYTVIPSSDANPQTITFMLGQDQVRDEVDALLKQCKGEVTELLRSRRVALERIRDELLDREELVGDRLEDLMNEIFPVDVAARTTIEVKAEPND